MFTGYGLVYSWKAKADYLNGFLRKRVVRVLWPYITANCFAILIYAIFDNGVIFRDALISFVSLRYLSSAWYVFAIILFYIAFYMIGKRAHNEKNLVMLLIAFWIVYFLVCVVTHQKTFWYNSSFCFVLGVVGAIQKQYSLKVNSKGRLFAYSLILVIAIAMIAFSPRKLILDLTFSTLFSALIAVFVFTFEIKNKVLDKLGGISYEVYLVHPSVLFMIKQFGMGIWETALLTIILSIVFAYFFNKLNHKLFMLSNEWMIKS